MKFNLYKLFFFLYGKSPLTKKLIFKIFSYNYSLINYIDIMR